VEDKFKGRAKEAAGAFTGDEEKKAEGRAQQRKGQASEEASQRAKTRQTEKEAKGPRGSATGRGARARGRWAASGIPFRVARDLSTSFIGPEPNSWLRPLSCFVLLYFGDRYPTLQGEQDPVRWLEWFCCTTFRRVST
jgi:uncharacterized protein YjbJ (UPF0337 family)